MISFLIGWPGGSLESFLKLIGLIFVAYALVLWLSAVVWVYRDVRSRTNDEVSQWIAVVLVGLFNLPGLIVYLVIRPQATLADPYERSLEAEAVLHELQLIANACQTCRRPIEDDFVVCPYCRTLLREPCSGCGRAVRTSWVTCPYCATERPRPQRGQPQAAAAPAAAAGEALQPPMRPPSRQAEAPQTRPPVPRRG